MRSPLIGLVFAALRHGIATMAALPPAPTQEQQRRVRAQAAVRRAQQAVARTRTTRHAWAEWHDVHGGLIQEVCMTCGNAKTPANADAPCEPKR